jgi:hypothetical protein
MLLVFMRIYKIHAPPFDLLFPGSTGADRIGLGLDSKGVSGRASLCYAGQGRALELGPGSAHARVLAWLAAGAGGAVIDALCLLRGLVFGALGGVRGEKTYATCWDRGSEGLALLLGHDGGCEGQEDEGELHVGCGLVVGLVEGVYWLMWW